MRNYGRFTTGITRDGDFRKLTAGQQGLYFMLGLQPEMTAAGVLSLTVRRWANMSAGASVQSVRDDLAVLEEHGHIVTDDDTEELLIVKFVKWDGGLDNAKRNPVIRDAACAIASERIRHSLASELRGIGHTDLADALTNKQSRFDRSVVTKDELGPHSETSLPEGEPLPPVDDGPPSPFCSKHPNGTEKPCGACGTAKMRLARWEKTHRERDARAAKARADCPLCDEHGIRLDPDTRRPSGRCDHLPLGAVS